MKLYEDLPTQGTHHLSSNSKVENVITARKKTQRKKNEKNTGPLVFHTDAIIQIQDPS